MQYPIIDNLIYAYIENDWTGLDPFSIWDEYTEYGSISNTTGLDVDGSGWRSLFIKVVPNKSYWLQSPSTLRIYWYDSNFTFIESINTRNLITAPSNAYYLRIRLTTLYGSDTYRNDISINIPSSTHYYIKSNSYYNDISHRLKLPMIHYFPHSVIDALISAADGQHTDEEKEILRHYLTPLGIGGI